jgi:hypothetical protein
VIPQDNKRDLPPVQRIGALAAQAGSQKWAKALVSAQGHHRRSQSIPALQQEGITLVVIGVS